MRTRGEDQGKTIEQPFLAGHIQLFTMDPTFWNQRFAETEPVYGTEPNEFLASQTNRIRATGRALCIGEGEGRNAVWLASRGMSVTAVDFSDMALERTRSLASKRGVEVTTLAADLTDFEPDPQAFDTVVSIFVHLPPHLRPVVHRRAFLALRPGGVFLAEYFSKDQLTYGTGGPKSPEMLYTVEELRKDFELPGAFLECLRQEEVMLKEGRYHQGVASVLRVVVRREIGSEKQGLTL